VPRPAVYAEDDILDAAAHLIRQRGPSGLRMTSVAARLGAPSGSVYHRYRSRDVLAASLWLRAIEGFQDGWLAAAGHDDPRLAVEHAAAHVLEWSRAHPLDAQILTLYRRTDLMHGDWPAELRGRNQRQVTRIENGLTDLARRLGIRSQADRRRLRFAVLDIPYGAVRGPLSLGEAPGIELDPLVNDAVRGVMARIPPNRRRA